MKKTVNAFLACQKDARVAKLVMMWVELCFNYFRAEVAGTQSHYYGPRTGPVSMLAISMIQ